MVAEVVGLRYRRVEVDEGLVRCAGVLTAYSVCVGHYGDESKKERKRREVLERLGKELADKKEV